MMSAYIIFQKKFCNEDLLRYKKRCRGRNEETKKKNEQPRNKFPCQRIVRCGLKVNRAYLELESMDQKKRNNLPKLNDEFNTDYR